jgi:putative alpha-1,2-mannosidase
MGGRDAAADALDRFFSNGDVKRWSDGAYDYYGRATYNPNNEPDLHAPWVYAWTSRPWTTSAIVRGAERLFAPVPEGLTGNDDLGTMSAWYVFAALGLYPVTSGGGTYVLHSPLFPRATVRAGGRTVTFDAPAAAAGNVYVQDMTVGGAPWSKAWIAHDRLLSAGTIHYGLGARPGPAWGTAPQDAPPSPCGSPG